MADSTIKKVQVTGAAAESFAGGGNKTRRKPRGLVAARQVQKEPQKGGDNSGALVQLTTSSPSTTGSAPTPPTPAIKGPIVGVSETKVGATLNPSPVLKGGASTKAVKVVLAPKKKTQKVVLSPAKKVVKLPASTGAPATTTAPAAKKVRGKTHKAARRIRVSVEGLTKRMNRAKTIKKESQTLTLEKLKEELVAAGLIKKESKAPESILRQMYTDFQLLKQRAL